MLLRLAVVASLLVAACALPSPPASVPPDLWEAEPDLLVKAGFWKECVDGNECASGYCYKEKGMPAGHCSQACTRDCPESFECKTVRYDDTVDADLCIPAQDTFCNKCTLHRDCGDSSDLCIPIGGSDRFCSVDCSQNPSICPPGFTCQKLGTTVSEFPNAMQCVPTSNICCVDLDKDGRGRGGGCIAKDCNDNDPRVYDDAKEICDGVDNDCKGGVDNDQVDCKKPECSLGQFGYFQRAAEVCMAGKCAQQKAMECGLYTCDGGGEDGDLCAIACNLEDDKKCVPPAHCDNSKCVMDLPDGSACDEASDCQSGHCQNGYCCASGDCCQQASNCPGFGTFKAVCDDPATCQGSKGAATCNSFRCATANGVPDDSACDAKVEANNCGFYKSIYCNGNATQSPPTCPTTCASHADCDANGFCDPMSKTCVEDLDNGRACGTDPARCKSGHCQNGFCCASGDCCAVESDCPTSYSSPPVCTTPTACQGTQKVARCMSFACSSQSNVDNDSACDSRIEASDCGPYLGIRCNGSSIQNPPVCPTTCTSSAQCDQNAYCSAQGACVPDEVNGRPCRSGNECISNHCQNGFCCASGDCCGKSSDCAKLAQAAVCNSQTTCQGNRVDGVCNSSFQCSPQAVDDDSACAGLKSNDCGPYPPINCTGAQTQPSDQAGLCSKSCTGDLQCDPSAHCENGVCVPDIGPGGYCSKQSDCASNLFCVDSVCCNTACAGTCEACDVTGSVGTCTAIPVGQDPAGECGGVSCAGYYAGWTGSTCYRKADVSAAQAACNGARACRSIAQECTAQATRGAGVLTCEATCQTPRAGTCTGTTAGVCDNLSLGSATCGQGVCQVSAPKCVNGAPNACVPNSGAATTETCNDIDDNCDGQIDNNSSFADSNEANNDCNTYRTLPTVGSNQTLQQNTLTLYPSGDVDTFLIRATESDSTCACCDFFCTDEDYKLVLTLSVPAGAGSYKFCTDTACGNAGNNCQTVNAGQSAAWTWSLDGACPDSDSYSVYVRIEPGNAPGFECAPYTLKYQLISGQCL